MKVLVLGLVCIVWLQSSCSAPKWSGHKSGDLYVDDSDPLTDYDFSVFMATEPKGNHFKTPQEIPKDYKTKPPSVFWAVLTAMRGIYVLWMIQFFCSWFLKTDENLDTDCRPPTDDSEEDNGSQSSEDSFNTVESSPAFDNVPEIVQEVVELVVDVVVLAETLVEDVAVSVDMQVGDGVSPKKFLPVDPPMDSTECQETANVSCDPERIEAVPDVDEEIVAGSSTSPEDLSSDDGPMDSPETELLASAPENSSMETTEREVLASNPADTAVPGTSGEVQMVPDEEPVPVKKPNFFRRAKKALKKWKKSLKKTPEDEPPEPKTLEEINRMWQEEETPYLSRIPKVHFRQRVEVKTFLVNKPMARYQEEHGRGSSEVTQVRPLKKEGEFKEVGVFLTKKSFKHRVLRGAMRLEIALRKG